MCSKHAVRWLYCVFVFICMLTCVLLFLLTLFFLIFCIVSLNMCLHTTGHHSILTHLLSCTVDIIFIYLHLILQLFMILDATITYKTSSTIMFLHTSLVACIFIKYHLMVCYLFIMHIMIIYTYISSYSPPVKYFS